MSRWLILLYGVVTYVVFLASLLYAVGFIGGFVVPKTIDSGPVTDTTKAILINLALLSLFAIQHSVMARPFFKRWWTLIVGFLIAFWATPEMTQGHLLFAAVVTIYVLVALRLEERDLLVYHGATYSTYQRQVRMLVPLPVNRRSRSEAAPGGIETEQVRPGR